MQDCAFLVYHNKLIIIISGMAPIAVALCRLINFYSSGIQYRSNYLIPIAAVVFLLIIFICSVTWIWRVRYITRSTHKEIIPSGKAIDAHARVCVTNVTLLPFFLKAAARYSRFLKFTEAEHFVAPTKSCPLFPLTLNSILTAPDTPTITGNISWSAMYN